MGGLVKGITSGFGSLLGGGSKSTPVAPPPPAPTGKDPAVTAAEEEERRKRANSGRASTQLTDPALGVTGSPMGVQARKLFTGE